MSYAVQIAEMFCVYAILGLTLNLVMGYGGLLSLSHGIFFGLGAYTTALLMLHLEWQFLPACAAAIAVCSFVAIVFALPTVRLRGDYFVLSTVALHMIGYCFLYNLVAVTRGPYGITGIPCPAIAGIGIASRHGALAIAFGSLVIVTLLQWQLARSPFGRVLRAVRDDETAALSLGKSVVWVRGFAFGISGGLAAIAGGAFAVYHGYLHPASFTLNNSVLIVTLVVVGGSGTIRGPLVGALFVTLLPELLRFLPVADAGRADLQQIIFGLLLVLAMRFRPEGLAGVYRYD